MATVTGAAVGAEIATGAAVTAGAATGVAVAGTTAIVGAVVVGTILTAGIGVLLAGGVLVAAGAVGITGAAGAEINCLNVNIENLKLIVTEETEMIDADKDILDTFLTVECVGVKLLGQSNSTENQIDYNKLNFH